MPIAAFADGGAGQFGLAHRAVNFLAMCIEHLGAGWRHHRPVAVFHVQDLIGQRRQRQGI